MASEPPGEGGSPGGEGKAPTGSAREGEEVLKDFFALLADANTPPEDLYNQAVKAEKFLRVTSKNGSDITEEIKTLTPKDGDDKDAHEAQVEGVWEDLLQTMKARTEESIRPFDSETDNARLWKVLNTKPMPFRAHVSGLLLDESILAGAVVRYWFMAPKERDGYAALYFSLKRQLKRDHRATYDALREMLRRHRTRFFDMYTHNIYGSWPQYLASLTRILEDSITEAPGDIATLLQNGLPTGSEKSIMGALLFPVVAFVSILLMVVLSLKLGERDTPFVQAHRERLQDTLQYIMKDLEHASMRSAYRMSTVSGIFNTVFEKIGLKNVRTLAAHLPGRAKAREEFATLVASVALQEHESRFFSSVAEKEASVTKRAHAIMTEYNRVMQSGNEKKIQEFLDRLYAPFEKTRAEARAKTPFSRIAATTMSVLRRAT